MLPFVKKPGQNSRQCKTVQPQAGLQATTHSTTNNQPDTRIAHATTELMRTCCPRRTAFAKN